MDLYADLKTVSDKYLRKPLYYVNDRFKIEAKPIDSVSVKYDPHYTIVVEVDDRLGFGDHIGRYVSYELMKKGRFFFDYSKAKEKCLKLIEQHKQNIICDKDH
jgi:hypothetical protein